LPAYEEALRLLHRHRPRFRPAHARHQHRLHHRREHQQLSTACAACSRDYAVVVVEDCVDTMDGPALHDAALACIRTAFGLVMRSDEIHKL